ncbi:hypothetical protein Pmani_036740 [Petrolisthes manimaculis]|uniref:L1 transposable element RRM domain-containing protein n=1 Tax=Petrolisthes manimaculis TaxID=1843537 RepID=A0AAE1NJ25_9EUCA|nr:hypothetical protein Pmani_036740 [Petrolisthes manimaculis]
MELEAIKVLLDSQERTLRSAMDMVVKQLQDRINKAAQSVDEVIKSLEFSQAEVLDLKNEVKELTKSNKDKQLLLEEIQSKVSEQEQRQNYQEDYSRRNNLRITGLQEQPGGESWEETPVKVNKLLEDKLQLPAANLERAHRVGTTNSSYPRTTMVRFEKFSDREAAIRNAKKLKGTGIYLNEDLCPASMEKRKEQLPLLKKAKDEGKIAYFRHTRLIIRERMGQRQQTPVSFGASRDDDRFRIHDGVGAVGGGSVDCMLSAEGAVGFAHCGGGGRVRSSSPHPSSGEKATVEVPVTDSTKTGAPGTVSGEPLPRGAARMSTGATKKQEPTGGTVVQNQKNLRERKKR